jgi:hypothetical protein
MLGVSFWEGEMILDAFIVNVSQLDCFGNDAIVCLLGCERATKEV